MNGASAGLVGRAVFILSDTALLVKHPTTGWSRKLLGMRTMAASPGKAAGEVQGHAVEHNGKKYLAFTEGLATILFAQADEDAGAKSDSCKPSQGQKVFYNPIQQFNRDLTVLAIKAYGAEVTRKREEGWQARMSKWAEKKRKRQKLEGVATSGPPAKFARRGSGDVPADAPAPGARFGGVTSEKIDEAATSAAMKETRIQAAEHQLGTHNGEEDQESANEGGSPTNEPQKAEDKASAVPFKILDALSATGLRALRYAHEIPFASAITAVDMSKSAVEVIRVNVDFNNVGTKVQAVQDDALAYMYSLIAHDLRQSDHSKPQKSGKYDVIDLDPYGTAATFFDAALQAVRNDGGLICITCTDTGVWASNGWPEKAFSLYGGVTMKGVHSHEAGLRLILHALATSAARYSLTIEPLLSLSIDFYGRMFVRIRRSPAAVKFHASKTMVVYNCDAGCGAWTTQPLLRSRPVQMKKIMGYKHGYAAGPAVSPLCEHCRTKTHIAGPMYAGRLHSPAFIESILAEVSEADPEIYGTLQRIEGMLTTALEETTLYSDERQDGSAGTDQDKAKTVAEEQLREAEWAAADPHPFFFELSQISSILRCQTPSEPAMRGALMGLGYRVTRSHCKPGSMKTDAPWSVIWRVMREWVRQRSPVKQNSLRPGMAGYRLLSLGEESLDKPAKNGSGQEDEVDDCPVVFDEEKGRIKEKRLLRYQQNPRENWGPMARALGK
jgi:tRNA (guanine26-N2/guanine27-N2)-dimethyltransferase